MEWISSNLQYYLKFSETEKIILMEYDRIIEEGKKGKERKEELMKPNWIKILKETSYDKQSPISNEFFKNKIIENKQKKVLELMIITKEGKLSNNLIQKTIFGLTKGGLQYVKQQLDHANLKTKVVNHNIMLILKNWMVEYSKLVFTRVKNEEIKDDIEASYKIYYFQDVVYQKILSLLLPMSDAEKNKNMNSVMGAMEIIAFLVRSLHYEPVLRMIYNSSIQLVRLTFERIQMCHNFLQEKPHKSYRHTIIYAYHIISSMLEFRNYKYVKHACSQFPLDQPTLINTIWDHICSTSTKGNNEYTQTIALPAVHSMVYLAMYNEEVRKLLIQYKPLKERISILLYDFINLNEQEKHIYSAEFTKCAFKFCFLLWGHKEFQIPFITLELRRDENPHHHVINQIQMLVKKQSKDYINNISLFIYLIETLDRLIYEVYDDLDVLTFIDYEIAEIVLKLLVELCYEFEEIVLKDLHSTKNLERFFMVTIRRAMCAIVDDSMDKIENEAKQQKILHQLRFGLATTLKLTNFMLREDVYLVKENIHEPIMKMKNVSLNAINLLKDIKLGKIPKIKLPKQPSKPIDLHIHNGLVVLIEYVEFFEEFIDDSDESYEGFFLN